MPKAEPLVIPFFNSGLFTYRSQLFAPYRSLGVNIVSYHDSAIDGQDMELITKLEWQRRPGFTRYCSQAFAANEVPIQFYGARSPSHGVLNFVDTNLFFSTFNATTITHLVGKSTTAQGFVQQVGGWTYYANGVDFQKWDGSTVSSWGIQGPTETPVITSTGNGQFWQPNFSVPPHYIVLDSNGFFQESSTGITGAATPIWNVTFNGATVDNTAVWTNRGPYTGWTLSNLYVLGTVIVDSNSNLQEVTTAGTSGATAPAWGTTIGGTTTDSGVTWTMRGTGFTGAVSSLGPLYPGIVSQIIIGSGHAWSNINAIKAADGANATVGIPDGEQSNLLYASNFGFSIPGGASISGILVEVNRSSTANSVGDFRVQLVKAGTPTGNTKAAGIWPSTPETQPYGGSSDLWGNSLSPADVNSAGFGVTFGGQSVYGLRTGKCDFIRITVYYNAPTGATLGTGSVQAQAGYSYVASYHMTSFHTSTASPPTYTTGPILGQFTNTLQVPASANAACDTVDFYRNADGGFLYYYLGSVPNPGSGTVSFVDNTIPDTSLITQRIAPINHLNDPPPLGMTILAYWMGRNWGAVGNLLYFDAGPDCTNGVPAESWPPANVFAYPGPITGLSPTSQGLLVWGADYISMALGGPQTLSFYPYDLLKGLGISSPNCLSQDRDTLSILSTQGRCLQINTAGEVEIDNNVADLVNATFDPPTAYITTHRNGTDSGVWIGDGSTNLLRYGVTVQAWSTLYKPVGGIQAIRTIETSPGNYSLLAGRPSGGGYILFRDVNNWQDDGQNYTNCFVTIGSITMSQPGKPLVPLEYIVGYFDAVGTLGPLGGVSQQLVNGSLPLGGPSFPSVYILPNEVSGTTGIGFQPLVAATPTGALPEPPTGQTTPSTTLLQLRWPVDQMQGLLCSQLMHHVQVKFVFAPENAPNTIKAMALMFEKD